MKTGMRRIVGTILAMSSAFGTAGCNTKAVHGLFSQFSETEFFSLRDGNPVLVEVQKTEYIQTPIDLLFVIDNSGSMEDDQTSLAKAFGKFSDKYLVPSDPNDLKSVKDLRIFSITTDTYMAGLTAALDTTGGWYPHAYPLDYATTKIGYHDGKAPSWTNPSAPRSRKPVLSTVPGPGIPADTAWFNQLNADFTINASPGTSAMDATVDNNNQWESGLSSIIRFINVNEKSNVCLNDRADPQCFFRKDSVRAVIILSDERDNCAPVAGFCPSGATRAAAAKSELDQFFNSIDQTNGSNPNYMVTAIVAEPSNNSSYVEKARYPDLANSVKTDVANKLGAYSSVGSITTPNLEVLLDNLGTVVQKSAVANTSTSTEYRCIFQLKKAPISKEKVTLTLNEPGHSAVTIPLSNYEVNGTQLQLNCDYIKQFSSDSQVKVDYLPG